jgi:hypothetical protein
MGKWHSEARAAERRVEAERVAAYYRAQERAREERENAAGSRPRGPGAGQPHSRAAKSGATPATLC